MGSDGSKFEFNFFQIQPNSLRMYTLGRISKADYGLTCHRCIRHAILSTINCILNTYKLSYHLISFLQYKNFSYLDKISLERCIEAIYIAQMNSSVIFQSDSQPVAAALFSNLSLLNHSCTPNIRIEHNGVHVKVRVSKRIGLVQW